MLRPCPDNSFSNRRDVRFENIEDDQEPAIGMMLTVVREGECAPNTTFGMVEMELGRGSYTSFISILMQALRLGF